MPKTKEAPCLANEQADDAASCRPARFTLGTLDGNVGVHVSFAAGAMIRHLIQALEPFGLTQKQVAILWLIEDNPDIAKSDLARLLRVERATIQIMVRALEKQGLIRPERSRQDGRRVVLRLTDLAAEILPAAKAAVERQENGLKSRFSPTEAALIIDLMKRIYE